MGTLAEIVLGPGRRRIVVDECEKVLEAIVRGKSGSRAFMVKSAFRIVSTVKPGFVKGVIDALMDEFVGKLEPFYAAWKVERKGSFGDFLNEHPEQVAEELLNITDQRAKRTIHTSAKNMYYRLRPRADDHILDALPRVGRMIDDRLRKVAAEEEERSS